MNNFSHLMFMSGYQGGVWAKILQKLLWGKIMLLIVLTDSYAWRLNPGYN